MLPSESLLQSTLNRTFIGWPHAFMIWSNTMDLEFLRLHQNEVGLVWSAEALLSSKRAPDPAINKTRKSGALYYRAYRDRFFGPLGRF